MIDATSLLPLHDHYNMFFAASKVFSFLLTPIAWVFSILLFAVFTNNQAKRKKIIVVAVISIYFFSNSFILDEFMRPWELPAKSYRELNKYNAGIVLGGMLSYDSKLERIQFSSGVDRLLQAIELYKKGYIEKIFFVGGSGSVLYNQIKEAPLVKRYLLTMGIPQEDIIIESESDNTHENAEYAVEILKQKGMLGGKFLLFTSGIHMRRSIACFKKAGLSPETYSTDRYSGHRKFDPDHLLIPNVQALNGWNKLLHEIAGMAVYKIMGYA